MSEPVSLPRLMRPDVGPFIASPRRKAPRSDPVPLAARLPRPDGEKFRGAKVGVDGPAEPTGVLLRGLREPTSLFITSLISPFRSSEIEVGSGGV